jgi:hypothetical protein
MKSATLMLLLFALVVSVGCKKDETAPTTTVVNNNGPVAPTTTLKTGTLVAENGTPTAGTLSIVKDANNEEWVSFNANFTSTFATGTVTVYLAKTAARIGTQRTLPPPPVPNIVAVGFVTRNGAATMKIPGSSTGFGYVVLYCETAEINFGNATLN